jgi:hypothetical protein
MLRARLASGLLADRHPVPAEHAIEHEVESGQRKVRPPLSLARASSMPCEALDGMQRDQRR